MERFHRYSSASNFSVICELAAKNGAITFAYEPIVHCRDALSIFPVAHMQIGGEFNFVYANEQVARRQLRVL